MAEVMNRRNFLKLFAAAAPVAVIAPKVFFLPPRTGWIVPANDNLYLTLELVRKFERNMRIRMVSNPSGDDPNWVFYAHPAQLSAAKELFAQKRFMLHAYGGYIEWTGDCLMDMIPVDSQAVSAIGYQGGTLALKWRSTGKTSYHPGVPEATYQALMQAESKGKFIAQHIRKQHPAREA